MFHHARDGTRIHYLETGSGDPPILLVHGWSCDHTYFAPQFERFGRKHRVVAVDLRGHGQSDKPEQAYTMAVFADDLASLCGELGLVRPVVIGHSLGGMIAVELARRFPDLPSALVLADAPIVPTQWLRDGLQSLLEALRAPDCEEFQQAFIANGLFLPTDDAVRKARIVAGMSSTPQHVRASAMEGILAWDGAAAAQACTVPVLNLAAAHPLNDQSRLQELCPRWVNGQTIGAGHFHQLEVPEQVNAMVERFLAVSALQGSLA